MQDELARADRAVRELRADRNDRWYPRFHIAAQTGWINDPNGLTYFNGRYHVYFQHYPYAPVWGTMYWGHASSSDLVTWRHEPIAMAPSTDADRDGVFSGSAVVSDDGTLHAYYTGNRWRNGVNEDDGNIQVQCLATSEDGLVFEKHGVVVDRPAGPSHFRDPKVWRTGDRWYMVIGACSADNRGEIWLHTSEDLRNWVFDSVLFRDPNPDAFMLECPDMFQIGDKWVIAYCPMGPKPDRYHARNGHNAGYVVGEWAPGEPFRQLTDYRPIDWGGNFYAPQTFETPDGRRVMLAWMGSFTIPVASQDSDGWSGQMSVPRVVSLTEDDRLVSVPIDEVTKLRTGTVDHGAFELGVNDSLVIAEDVDSADVELEIDLTSSTAERIGLSVNKTPDRYETIVAYDDLAEYVIVDRRNAGHGDRGYRGAPFSGDRLKLRVLIDRGSVEVFVNDGIETLSSLTFASDGPRAIELYTESGTAKIDGLLVHRLRSFWEDEQ